MTGKEEEEEDFDIQLAVTEALKEIGHELVGPAASLWNNAIKLQSRIPRVDSVGLVYSVHIEFNEASFQLGNFQKFDFHSPNSIVLFQAAAMQMSILLVLRDLSEGLSGVGLGF